MLTGYYAQTLALNPAPDFTLQWTFDGEGSITSTIPNNAPVCFKNANGYRVIVKPVPTNNYNCYVLNTINGEQLSTFQCGGIPIIHYDKDSGNADIAIIPTGAQNSQILVTQINNDNIVAKELWYGDGDTNHGFIVNDYFVTAFKPDSFSLDVRVYDISTGNTLFEDLVTMQSGFTYALFGGLYDNGNDDFMITVRIDDTFRSYVQTDSTSTTTNATFIHI